MHFLHTVNTGVQGASLTGALILRVTLDSFSVEMKSRNSANTRCGKINQERTSNGTHPCQVNC